MADIQAKDSDPKRKRSAPAAPTAQAIDERLRQDMDWLEQFSNEIKGG